MKLQVTTINDVCFGPRDCRIEFIRETSTESLFFTSPRWSFPDLVCSYETLICEGYVHVPYRCFSARCANLRHSMFSDDFIIDGARTVNMVGVARKHCQIRQCRTSVPPTSQQRRRIEPRTSRLGWPRSKKSSAIYRTIGTR